MYTRFFTGLLLSASILTPVYQTQAQPQPDKPNVVLILADDLGWRDLSCMGSSYYETPAIDQLAEDGMLFSQAYASAPVCLPTRAALMTGKAPARLHMTAVFDRDGGIMPLIPPQWNNTLPHKEFTLAERFQELGYVTAIMGKWHLGPSEAFWPENHGFDVNVAAWASGRPDSFFPPYNNPRLSDGPAEEYLTDRIAKEAETFITAHADRPFFLYLPFYNPHLPLEAPQSTIEYFEQKNPDGGQKIPTYAAMIAHLDKAVDRILNTLKTNGLTENTIVIFTSDNGGVKTLGDIEVTDNHPLRSEKFLLYEGGIRVPLIVKWPGIIQPGSRTRQLAITTDFLPTLMTICGKPIEQTQLDGIDLTAVFRNGDSSLIERELGWHYPHYMPRQAMKPSSAFRSGDMKLIHWHEDHRIELYNLSNDLGETHDLSRQQPEQALELYQRLENWRTRVGAQMPRPNPAFITPDE